MNLSLIDVAQVHVLRPLSRSKDKLVTIADLLDNPRITPLDIQVGFAKYMAVILRARVQEAIRTQKLGQESMKSKYKPLSEPYAKSKPKGKQDKFWTNTGHLANSLVVWREKDVIKLGFKGSQYYPGTRTKTIRVLIWNEKGTKRIPARPLFIPIAKFLSRNMGRYFEAYVKHTFRIDVTKL